MGIVHFMNIEEGNCIWVKHPSGYNTVIDVSNRNSKYEEDTSFMHENSSGNYQ